MDPNKALQQSSPVQPSVSPQMPFPKPFPKTAIAFIVVILLAVLSLGTFIAISQRKSTKITQSITVSPTVTQPTPTVDPIANWKTYSSNLDNYLVSFQYPSSWTINPEQSLENQNTHGYSRDIKSLDGAYTLTLTAQENFNPDTHSSYKNLYDFLKIGYKVKELTIAGQLGVQSLPRTGSENLNAVYFFSKDNATIYSITLRTDKSDNVQLVAQGQQLFNQILSTFKFTDQSLDTSSWKTYTSTKYNYTVQYPADWTVTPSSDGNVTFSSAPMQGAPAIVDLNAYPTSSFKSTDVQSYGPFDSKTIEHGGTTFALIAHSYQLGTLGDSAKSLAVSTFNQMVSTFKFTQ